MYENIRSNEEILQRIGKRNLCSTAALNGNLELLKWARSKDPPISWDSYMCMNAAFNGDIDMIIWARSQDPPCPWDQCSSINALMKGHMDLVWYLYTSKAPYPCHVYHIHDNCRAFFEEFGEDWESGHFNLTGRNIKG